MKGVKILEKASMNAIVSELKPNGSYVGERYFPMVEEATDQTIWDVVTPGEGIAGFRALDAEAKLMGRKEFKQMAQSVADIAEKARMNVTDVRILREAGEMPVVAGSMQESMARRAERRVAEALARLRERVDNRLEWARISALQGAISYDADGVKFAIDYGVPANQTGVTPSVTWDTVATATPFNDLQTWMDLVGDATGVVPGEMIVSKKVLGYLAQNTVVRDYFKYTNPIISVSDVTNIIQDRLALNIVVYEARYTDSSNVVQRFLDEGRIILLPLMSSLTGQERFGDTAYVPHPHNNYTGSYYTWTDTKKDPWGIEVGVGLTALPRVYQPSVILTADVLT
jgi:hypothetical protein